MGERRPEGTPYGEGAGDRGDIFRGWRWGWLMALQPTVITRHAMETIGPNDTSYRVASDFGYLAELCRTFPVSFVSVPGCIKHELADGRPLSEGHLVTGRTAATFHEDVLRFQEVLFFDRAPDDPDLAALRGFRQTLVAQAALRLGERELALRHLRQAVKSYPGADTEALLWLARIVHHGAAASLVYRGLVRGAAVAGKLRRAVGLR